jgi:hypothetical protein
MAEKDVDQLNENEQYQPPENSAGIGFGETGIVRGALGEDFNTHQQEKRKQTIALASVAIIGVGIVVLGFWQMKNNLALPWPTVDEEGKAIAVQQEKPKDIADEDIEVLKQRDSDGDQISDFDEYYIYGTSAYLADSDSDGDSDYDEIQNGEDPNCEKGKQCFRTAEFVESGLGVETAETGLASQTGSKNSLLNISADDLRYLLVKSGKVSEEQLKIISDEDLLGMYKQMLAENPDLVKKFEAQAGSGENSQSAGGQITISDIKKALLSQGISESEISAFSDAELIKMYEEAVEKVKEKQ